LRSTFVRRRDRAMWPDSLSVMPTPERLDAMLDQTMAEKPAFQRRVAATKAFDGVLSPPTIDVR
jgi:hypothetical protein